MQPEKFFEISFLRCEYKVDPIGIDVLNPRFSWIVNVVKKRGKSTSQSAYRLIVSSSLNKIESDDGDLWDSGKVLSTEQNQVVYKGKHLQSNSIYYWKVKIWDNNDVESNWSKTAKFSVGLINQNDWKASWIGFDDWENNFDKQEKHEFEELNDKWIWFPLNETKNNKGFGRYFFRKEFFIKNEVLSAEILITADERFKLFINGILISESDDRIFSWTRPHKINVKNFLSENKNLIAVETINNYLSKPGLAVKLFLKFNNNDEEIIRTDSDWKSFNEEINNWNQLNYNDEEWIESGITALMGEKPWGIPKYSLELPPAKYLRKEFILKKEIKHALVYSTALGLYNLFINGVQISDDKLTPGWTDYNERIYYNSYDIKNLLKSSGKNCIGIILADGWYSGYIAWERKRGYYGKFPRAILQLEIEYTDGTREKIISDKSWQASYGAITQADLLMGESFDANNELLNWCTPDYDSRNWKQAAGEKNLKVQLNAHPGIPIRKILGVKPVKITEPQKGIFIFDLGQNFAGYVRLKINGKKSGKISLRYAEMLDEKGFLYTENLRMARAKDTYISKGEAEEIWEPEFTYHGFRYVEVKGLNEVPTEETITGIVLHSDLPVTGEFNCSNKNLNRLFKNILWSQRSNFMDIPTDCPQRDERLGWTADAVDFIRTASFNMDTSAFYTKWLQDLNDAQEENGAYTAIAPKPDIGVGPLYSGTAGFADAGIITPYFLYLYYNDVSIFRKHYKNMQRFVEYLQANNFKRPEPGYGDWLSFNAETPQELIDSAFSAIDLKLMSEISLLLKKENEAKQYKKLFEVVRTQFNSEFVSADGSILSGTQTAYVLPLYFGLLDDEIQQKAFQFLVEDIQHKDWHVSTGFIGLTYLFPVLTKFGRSDIVYKLLLNESFPSWLNMINNGAVTMWERWDSWSKDKGFFDPLMNSFNHTSLGVIGEWFYSGIGGIIPVEAGFKKIIINPQIGGGLTYAKVSYNSIIGKISVDWSIEEEIASFNIKIPFNCSAKIILSKKIGTKIFNKLWINSPIELMEDDKNFIFNTNLPVKVFLYDE